MLLLPLKVGMLRESHSAFNETSLLVHTWSESNRDQTRKYCCYFVEYLLRGVVRARYAGSLPHFSVPEVARVEGKGIYDTDWFRGDLVLTQKTA